MKMLLCSSNILFSQVEKNADYSIREDNKIKFNYFGNPFVTSPIAATYRAGEFLLAITKSGSEYVFADSDTWCNVIVMNADFSVTRHKNVALRFIDGKCYIQDGAIQFKLGIVNEASFNKDTITMNCDYGTVSIVPGFYTK